MLVAMAGTHQIWQFNLIKNKIGCFAGNGKEAHIDSTVSLQQTSWAQPSGLSIIPREGVPSELLVADAESSTIRGINLETKQSSRNLVGGSENPLSLFAYGDKDGFGKDVRLQHALGVHWVDVPITKFGVQSQT